MDALELEEYLRGKVAGLERICAALFSHISDKMPTLADTVAPRVRVSSEIIAIIQQDITSHPSLPGTPFGQGLADALSDFRANLLR